MCGLKPKNSAHILYGLSTARMPKASLPQLQFDKMKLPLLCPLTPTIAPMRESGRQPLRVAREHARLPNVVQGQKEHHNALQAHARPSVRECAVSAETNFKVTSHTVGHKEIVLLFNFGTFPHDTLESISSWQTRTLEPAINPVGVNRRSQSTSAQMQSNAMVAKQELPEQVSSQKRTSVIRKLLPYKSTRILSKAFSRTRRNIESRELRGSHQSGMHYCGTRKHCCLAYLKASMYALIVFTSIPHSVARLVRSSGS